MKSRKKRALSAYHRSTGESNMWISIVLDSLVGRMEFLYCVRNYNETTDNPHIVYKLQGLVSGNGEREEEPENPAWTRTGRTPP